MALPPDVLKEVQAAIKEGKKRLKELEQDVRDAQRAKIDVGDLVKQVNDARQKLLALESVYGTGK